MRLSDQIEFAVIAETGALEQQALLFAESLREFGGRLASAHITVVSPRSTHRPCAATLARLDHLHAEYLPLDIAAAQPEYGTSFRVHALAHIARRPGPPLLVQNDSDTIFIAEPTALLQGAAAARPVDVKGMCATAEDNNFSPYWRNLCALSGVDFATLPLIETTVDRVQIRASYNGGLVMARRDSGIFQRTEEIFNLLTAANMGPWAGTGMRIKSGTGMVSEDGSAFWGSSQAALSLAATAQRHRVEILPPSYNFPLHILHKIPGPLPAPLVHLHYHWLATHPTDDPTGLFDPRLNLPRECLDWLRQRLPLAA